MAVTFSLPTVLARLADGHSTIEADGTTLGDAVARSPTGFRRSRPGSEIRTADRIRSSRST